MPTADLLHRLPRLSEAVNTVVIDTPPGHLGIITAAVMAADVVVVPVQPTLMDIDRVRATVDIATSQGKPAALLLSRTRARTRALTSTRQVLTEAGFPLLPIEVPQREAIAASWGSWLPPDALGLYYEIFSLLVQEVDEVTA